MSAIPNGDDLDTSPFSERVKAHPRVAWHQDNDEDPLVLAVNDQLLVHDSVVTDVRSILSSGPVVVAEGTTPVSDERTADDVHILQLTLPADGSNTIFSLAHDLRTQLGDPRAELVSPNHVLIPAGVGHSCPWGAPSPIANPPTVAPFDPTSPIKVAVIDAGYMWNPAWGANPLSELCPPLTVSQAEYDDAAGSWLAGVGDVPDADADGILDALAGHANFVAGVIAQGCRNAHITIINHNGGFARDSKQLPTEASVVRSLEQVADDTAVIYIGFAFSAFDDTVSTLWDRALQNLQNRPTVPVVVAPAGNQSDDRRRYPAGFADKYRDGGLVPVQYANVIGVGSVDAADPMALDTSPVCSRFSNHGAWVTCSAIGSNVVSTFLKVDMALEDERGQDDPRVDPTARDFAQNAWALWQGTSFAGPKVAAAIAARLGGAAPAATALEAWGRLANGRDRPDDGEKGVGIRFA